MPATLSDVARQAGVSPATASRVLNGRRHVAVDTRLRVEAAARALAYIPNRAARDLSLARTATIALLVHHAQYPAHGEGTFTSRVVDGVSRALRASGYDLLYVTVDDEAVRRPSAISAAGPGRTDGVLALGPAFPRNAIAALAATGRPLVIIDNRHSGLDAVLADNRPAAAALARHVVVDHGHRRLVALGGPAGWPSTRERIAGMRDVARNHGATLATLHARETTVRHGDDLAGALLTDPPEAVLAVNDAMAIGAMHRFRSLPVGRRPAVTGFDDIAWAQLSDPPLTTVAVEALEIGRAAADLLMTRIADPDRTMLPAREIRVPGNLRLRRSCGCR